MNELLDGVNWVAVLVGFGCSYLLGWVWYSPKVFGTKWAEGSGISLDGECVMPVFAMVVQALGTFGLAWLVGITATSNSLLTILLIVSTIILFIVSNGKYAQKSNVAVSIEASYILIMAVVMIACQGIL